MGDFDYLLDNQGRIKRWPKKKAEKEFVLGHIGSKFESGRVYGEKEVNQVIQSWHLFEDYALLRRELFDHFHLNRSSDGRTYWVDETRLQASAPGTQA